MKQKSAKQNSKTKEPIDKDYKTLNTLRDFCYAESKAKGWHTEENPNIGAFCANLHGEVSELWEAWRKGTLYVNCDKSCKMIEHDLPPLNCAEEEIADILIRAFDFSFVLKVDLAKAVKNKLLFNRTRAHRNGGKLA